MNRIRFRADAAVWLFIAAFVLRVAWVGVAWQKGGANLSFPDEDLHWQLGRSIVTQGAMVSEDGRFAARMPVYPLFLAAFAALGAWGVLAARLAQALAGAVTTYLCCRFAGAAGNRTAGLVVGLLVCCDPFAIYCTNLLLNETIFSLELVGFVACSWAVARDWPVWRRPARLGFVALAALLVMTRPEALLFIALAWVLVIGCAHPPRTWAIVWVFFAAAAVLCVMMPWGQRNRAILDDSAWLSTNGGVTLYDAQGPQAHGDSDQRFLKDMPDVTRLPEAARDRELRRLALEQMARDPLRVLRLAGVKLARTWSPLPNIAEQRHGVLAYAGAAYTIVLVLAAIAGAIAVRRSQASRRLRAPYLALVWSVPIFFTLITCIFIGSVRYRVPMMPFLSLAAAPLALLRRPGPMPRAEH